MGFGLSFGHKSQSTTTTSSVDKTENTDQTKTGTQTQTGTVTDSGSQNTTSNQNQATTGSTTNTGTQTGTQQSTQTSSQFSQPVLSALEQKTQELLNGIGPAPAVMPGSFNHDQFVQQGMDAARSQITSQLDQSLNSIFDTVGGRDDQNSMATLLATQARGQAAGSLAGANANLESTAQGIEKDRFLANLQGQQTQGGILEAVVSALKGGTSSTTGNVATSQQTAETGTQNQNTATTGSQNTATANTQTTDLQTAINEILNGMTHTTGTETDKTKGSSTGFGAGLSL